MPKNYIQPATKRATKTYNRPSMKRPPAVSAQQLQRDWNDPQGPSVSYATRVDQVELEAKHKAQRTK